ncbi:metallophosphoesterase [Pseudovibrio sp. FO-BEG1]|uniref:metallophosphoesterase n=1 Tax=Pseudovibrio sp. (strain FO-BEG1) TaxID=911045 RepID=UPI000238CEE6|nr:metallophosphoesterase [Pseudovibrio sp. FO-BEG1]AEV39211.1 metallophosphoesterase [Pseudovibrio sp. FO-BEG1]
MPKPYPTLPEGTRIYAVGDIHGRLDLLETMGKAIESDLKKRPIADPVTVFLGDYIDRGPDSQGVIDFLVDNHHRTPRQICLKGNHEASLLEFLEDAGTLYHWEDLGGMETLLSYGLSHHDLMGSAGAESVQTIFRENFSKLHETFFRSLELYYKRGDYLFVHAGIRPEVALEEQSEDELMWIRGPFLNYEKSFGLFVVHGHTPVEHIDRRTNRLDVDTEAYASGQLTCAVLEGSEMQYITATTDGWELFDFIPTHK